MKVAIASTVVPFVLGGGRYIVDWLETMLERSGHQVETYRLPFSGIWYEIPEQTAALRLLELPNADRFIAIRTPSYVIRHPAKTIWFIHHIRAAYDLWGSPLGGLPDTPYGRAVRDCIHRADDVALGEAQHIYTNSGVVSKRLLDYNGITAPPLYPPLFEPERFRCEPPSDYVLYTSRICPQKRQTLALDAMQFVTTPVKLKLVGPIEYEKTRDDLVATIRERGLGERVELIDRFISEEEKIELFARALAIVYVPFDEDSYGYPSLEAAAARKPVIATTDSGGTRELIVDGSCGWMTEPTPQALARAFDEAYADRKKASAMGEAMNDRVRELGIEWPATLEKILA
ncbi:MAG: glycosyltransferase family 4 protein [Candidatus Eremiobacteraeota bacterium]|nr:glycosyltransferase family 4 protein [Candidatus Eremiobacteraeota bacterium]